MIPKKSIFPFLLSIFLGFNAFASQYNDSIKYVSITDISIEQNLSVQTEIFTDSTGKLDIYKIVENEGYFRKESPFNKSYSSKYTHWLKIKVFCNTLKNNEIILTTGYASFIDAYLVHSGKVYSHQKTGLLYEQPNQKDPVFYYFSGSVKLTLVPSDTTIIYVKYKNVATGGDISIYPNLVEKAVIGDWLLERNQNQGIFQGIIIIMILYHLLLFVSLRDKLYIFYSVYLFFILLSFLFPFGYFWKLGIGKRFWLWPILAGWVELLAVTFYMLFIKYFIQTHAILPKWDKAIRINILLPFIIGIASCAYYFKTYNEDLYFNVINFYLIASILFSIILLIPINRSKNKLHNYYIGGTIALAFCMITGVIMLIIKYYEHNLPQYIIQLGVILQIISFALGLGKKMKSDETEKLAVQARLIEQLNENEKLQTKVNRELEQKVRERTQEIEQANEEIKTQADNLMFANIKLMAQNEVIEKANKEMTDSIQYALRIQKAVFPHEQYSKSRNFEHFTFYQPRDIVSGDFFFHKETKYNYIFAAADCTGHGVPGAFMSMLGATLLNEIIAHDEKLMPDEVLNQLREGIKTSMHQTGAYLESQDGMDIALCFIDKKNSVLHFAGAHNPLIICRNNQIIEYKADRMPISIFTREKPFALNSIKLETNDVFYIFSDGYSSQFNGQTDKKFQLGYFKRLLLEIYEKPIGKQHDILMQVFNEWKNVGKQTDDVLVVGVRKL